MTIEELRVEALKLGYTLVKGEPPKFGSCPKCGYTGKCTRGRGDNNVWRECNRCHFRVTVSTEGIKEYRANDRLKVEWNLARD
jgi:hypothetical protein